MPAARPRYSSATYRRPALDQRQEARRHARVVTLGTRTHLQPAGNLVGFGFLLRVRLGGGIHAEHSRKEECNWERPLYSVPPSELGFDYKSANPVLSIKLELTCAILGASQVLASERTAVTISWIRLGSGCGSLCDTTSALAGGLSNLPSERTRRRRNLIFSHPTLWLLCSVANGTADTLVEVWTAPRPGCLSCDMQFGLGSSLHLEWALST